MKNKAQEIEETINKLLDKYDNAMMRAKQTRDINKENQHKQVALDVTDCIEHEMKKLRSLSDYSEEIVITTMIH